MKGQTPSDILCTLEEINKIFIIATIKYFLKKQKKLYVSNIHIFYSLLPTKKKT